MTAVNMDTTSADNVFVFLECEFCTGLFPVDAIELHIKVGHEYEISRPAFTDRLIPIRRAFAVTHLQNYKGSNGSPSPYYKIRRSRQKRKSINSSKRNEEISSNEDTEGVTPAITISVKDEPEAESWSESGAAPHSDNISDSECAIEFETDTPTPWKAKRTRRKRRCLSTKSIKPTGPQLTEEDIRQTQEALRAQRQDDTNSDDLVHVYTKGGQKLIPIEIKQLIVKHHQEGRSNADIALLLSCDKKIIDHVLRMWRKHGTLYTKTTRRRRHDALKPRLPPPKVADSFGWAVIIKSKQGNDVVRYESEVHPGRFYEFCFRSKRLSDQQYFGCMTCAALHRRSIYNGGGKLPEPMITVRNGLIMTDPDNPSLPHHCQGYTKPAICVRDALTEMFQCAYTNGGKLGSTGVWQYAKDRLERSIVDLSDADKEQARKLFPSCGSARKGMYKRITQGCLDRGEQLPEALLKHHESKAKSNDKPKRVRAKSLPERAYVAGDGYVVNEVNFVPNSEQCAAPVNHETTATICT